MTETKTGAEGFVAMAEEVVKLRNSHAHLREEVTHLRLDLAVLLDHLKLTFEDIPAKPAERRLVSTYKFNRIESMKEYATGGGGSGLYTTGNLDQHDLGGA